MSKTLQQRTNHEGYPKSGELITMAGLEDLEASQRAISNMLYQHAHDSGRMAEPGAVFEIPMVSIRRGLSKHESGDRLRASLVALARVVATVTYIDEDRGQQRVIVGGLFEFFDVAKQDLGPGTTLRYALNRNLVAVIDRSARGTVAKLGVRRPLPVAGVGRWPAGISARNRCRACRCRGRSGPGAADRPHAGSSASAAPWPCGGSPGSWPCPRSAPCRPAARPGAVRRSRPDGRSGSVDSGPPRLAPAAACERARSRRRARVRECDRC